MDLLPSNKRHNVPALVYAALVVLTGVLVAGCGTGSVSNPGGKVETPTFSELQIPDPGGAASWVSYATISPPFAVLPTKGRAMRLYFYAPLGSIFSVSLRELDGTVTPLTESEFSPDPPQDGHFDVLEVDPNQNPPRYTMFVRAPSMLTDPVNFDILVVHRSMRTDMEDSDPMVVSLRRRPLVYTVTISVQGSGHVTSSPAGIECGTSPSGRVLTPCSFNFGGAVPVRLNPNSNDLNTTRFLGWTGNCPPGVQVCEFTLDGTVAINATAHFGARTATLPMTCPAAPALPGLTWIDLPGCSDPGYHPGITLACDANGYFCCAPNSSSNEQRCGGQGQQLIEADCRHRGPAAILRQPGGCYEVR